MRWVWVNVPSFSVWAAAGRKNTSVPMSASSPGPAAGWLPTDHHTLEVTGHERIYALGDATDLPLSKAGSTAHFEAPIVVERLMLSLSPNSPAEAFSVSLV